MNDTITVAQAAEILGISRRAVNNLIAAGKVQAQMAPRRTWLIRAADVAQLAAERRPAQNAIVRAWALAQAEPFTAAQAVAALPDVSSRHVFRALKALANAGELKRCYPGFGAATLLCTPEVYQKVQAASMPAHT